jgi:hypothetical protein
VFTELNRLWYWCDVLINCFDGEMFTIEIVFGVIILCDGELACVIRVYD